MIVYKGTIVLSCLLLIGHHATAVVNKGSPQGVNGNNKEETKKNEIKADDRISNSYGPPADDYGPPLDSPNFNRPPPVYGPPEITGNLEPSPIYPPPPSELPPPPIHGGPPSLSFGPPRSPKPVYGPPKQSYGPPKSNIGPPKSHHGFPKPQYGAPPLGSFGSFRPPKPQYGPPKFGGSLSSSYLPAIPLSTTYGIPKGNHGPSIPISLESYGPPPSDGFAVQFGSSPSNEYGAPQPQYGGPVADSYGPPPPGPPPGVPAPPTPPDIKYDGWQPIAGAAPSNNHDGIPQDTYGPPSNGLSNDYTSTASHSSASSSLSTDPNIPSDSYGVPILSKEAQNLKQSVHQPSSATENDGLPPPPLPQYDPLYNQSPPRVDSSAQFAPNAQQTPHSEYGVPKVEPVSIVKTVGFELLPTSASLPPDSQGLSLSHSSSSHGHSLDSGIGGAGIQDFGLGQNNIGYDITLPQFPVQTPSNDYGPPLGGSSVGQSHDSISGLPLAPPPVNSYGAPSPPSFPGGSYLPPHTPRGGPSFASFGLFTSSYLKHGSHHSRHGPFRHGPPLPPAGSMIPPRNREPIKFKEPIPTGILSMINRYLPPSKSSKSHGSSHFTSNQQLPTISGPISFHHSSGRSGSYAKSNSHALNSPIVAPNAQYGTPLTFTDFNTPAPVITYGAPNFGPPTTFVSTTTGFGSNLYNNVGDSLPNTYGTPVVNFPQTPIHSSGDCGSQKSQFTGSTQFNGDLGSYSSDLTGPAPLNLPTAPGEQQSLLIAPALPPLASNALTNSYLPPPPVNELDLDSRDQPKTDLRDSYGNPIGVSIDVTSSAEDLRSSSTGISKVIPVQSFSSQSRNVFPEGGSSQHGEGLSAEALTASLTAKGFGQANYVNANEVDPSQFLKTQEGSEALALAERLTAEGANGFQIQGSKGTYTLQIQPADGGFGTENSDGSIRHDQVLSNGLLQDILAAIEQPDHGQAEQVQPNASQDQSLREVYGDLTRAASHNGVHLIRIGDQNQNEIQRIMSHASDRSEESNDDEKNSSKHEAIALFFNNGNRKDANDKNESHKFEDSKETRSVSKSEEQITVSGESQKSESKDTSS